MTRKSLYRALSEMLFGAGLHLLGVIETSYTETLDEMLFQAVLQDIFQINLFIDFCNV